jgi:quercetin dioxygenase-like cupin family protein
VIDFPSRIAALPAFEGPFDAHRLAAEGCDVLFARYPAGAAIDAHSHESHNVGVIIAGELILTVDGVETRHGIGSWYELRSGTVHAARFEVDTAEIELWFQPHGSAT